MLFNFSCYFDILKKGGKGMHWGNYGYYGWGMGFGWLFMIAFWILVLLGVIYGIKMLTGTAKREEKQESAIDILKKRYAKGEISKEEFEKIKDDLKGT
jgi:putative membrane protein